MRFHQCTICREVKSRKSFHKRNEGKGIRSECKICTRKRNIPIRTKEYNRDMNLKKNFGITAEEYNRMLIEQKGKCGICHSTTPNSKQYSNFNVDHDHGTGQIRGLLCTSCNRMLGFAHDNIEILNSAVKYLSTHSIINQVLMEVK